MTPTFDPSPHNWRSQAPLHPMRHGKRRFTRSQSFAVIAVLLLAFAGCWL